MSKVRNCGKCGLPLKFYEDSALCLDCEMPDPSNHLVRILFALKETNTHWPESPDDIGGCVICLAVWKARVHVAAERLAALAKKQPAPTV